MTAQAEERLRELTLGEITRDGGEITRDGGEIARDGGEIARDGGGGAVAAGSASTGTGSGGVGLASLRHSLQAESALVPLTPGGTGKAATSSSLPCAAPPLWLQAALPF